MPLDDTTNWSDTTTTDETTALLIRARGLLERGWCRGADAKNFLGLPVSAYSILARAWCASGALLAARAGASDLNCRLAQIRMLVAVGGEVLHEFNDRQETVEPVLAAFDRAIAAGKSTR
jgi:hypothetical protein